VGWRTRCPQVQHPLLIHPQQALSRVQATVGVEFTTPHTRDLRPPPLGGMDLRPQVPLLSLLHSCKRPFSSFLFFIHAGAERWASGRWCAIIFAIFFFYLQSETHPKIGMSPFSCNWLLTCNIRRDFRVCLHFIFL
jgi:hypothetical protein